MQITKIVATALAIFGLTILCAHQNPASNTATNASSTESIPGVMNNMQPIALEDATEPIDPPNNVCGYARVHAQVERMRMLARFCDEKNDLWSCVDLAGEYINIEYANDTLTAKARDYLKKACNGKYVIGCFKLGLLYLDNKDMQDYKKARKYLTRACFGKEQRGVFEGEFEKKHREDQKNAIKESCLTLARLYTLGKGGEKDYAKANAILERIGCDKDSATSCPALGE